MQSLSLPDWVVARLKQDNPDVSKAIVDMVIWVDRIKCWLYQTDADLAQIVDALGNQAEDSSSAKPATPDVTESSPT